MSAKENSVPRNGSTGWKFLKTDYLEFIINGDKIKVDTNTITPKTTLNEYLRKTLNLTGTKYNCLQGGCGSCIVVATFINRETNTKETKAINSVTINMILPSGWEITTVESLHYSANTYNEIIQKIVQYNATQCGFCTPGWVMNMYALQKTGKTKMADIENSFGGNLCRCTGYRPILTAFKSMASDANQNLIGTWPDIEDLEICTEEKKKKCCKSCLHENVKLPLIMRTKKLLGGELEVEANWYKVTKVSDIFNIFSRNAGKSYQLVAGNTARGVYTQISNRDYFIDINDVIELKGCSHNTKSLVIGANVTLNDAITIFQNVGQSDEDFKHLIKVAAHIDLVAHVPVRNIGTIAGNLSIKHTYKEFPSDIFLLLETINAQLIIDNGSRQRKMCPSEYLEFDMDKNLILSIEIPPLDETYRFESYKIMKRAQNSHAIINAGFLFKFTSNVVDECRIVYGGVNANFVHASITENLIQGKVLFDNNNMQRFFSRLMSELRPDDFLPQPKPEFRKKLCVSLLYKYILSIAPSALISKSHQTGGTKLIRPPVSTGVQEFDTGISRYPIGEPISKIEAKEQASGQAKYVADVEDLHGQLFAVFVEGNAPAGSILKAIDPGEALRVEGVEAFFQASDIPGVNSFMIPIAVFGTEDEEIFLPIRKSIKYFSQPVGMIVAKSQLIAEEAAKLVKVTFEQATSAAVLTTEEAIEDPLRVQPFNIWLPLKQNLLAPIKFSGQFESLAQYHNYMELCVASVQPEDNDSYTVHVGCQWMDAIQSSISRSMNIPAHKISVFVKRVGGSYGGKINRANWAACAATLAALKLKKPVKCFMSLEANMNIIGKRHMMLSKYDVGVDQNGLVGYIRNNIYSNTGHSKNAWIELFINEVYEGPYKTDAFYTEIDIVKSDLSSCTYMRSPGYMEGSAMIENIMEHIAYETGIDPVDVRLVNLKNDSLIQKFMKETIEWSNYRKRRAAIEQFNRENTWRKKGISLIPMIYALSGYFQYYAQVSIYAIDGTVAISHGGTELGQGINTKVAQVASYIFGIPMSMITILPSNNFIAPNNFSTGGSVTSESICWALQKACNKLLDRIVGADIASKLPVDALWVARIQNAYILGVPLTENAGYSHDQIDPIFYNVYGVGVSEIELDVLTGQIVIQRADLLEDTGEPFNPAIEIGQVEGAYVMAVGHWTSEEIIYDEYGALKTNSTWEYKIPGARDIPVDFRVKLPTGTTNPLTPFKNKATSEPPFCLGFTVPLAIKHALSSVRTQFGLGVDPWTTMDGPCSVEWIFLNGNHNISQYTL